MDSAKTIRVRDRSVIQFCFNLGFSQKRTLDLCSKAYPDSSPSRSHIYSLFKYFSTGQTSLEEDKPTGRPGNLELIFKIADYLDEHPYASACSIAREFSITKDTATSILRTSLERKKVNFKWIPHHMSLTNKAQRIRD